MFKFDNSHLFTGYLKQLLSTVNLPTCRIYTNDFAKYLAQHGKEDPRVIESFDTIRYTIDTATKQRVSARVNYLKGNELYNYIWNYAQNKPELGHNNAAWKPASSEYYDNKKMIPGLTRVLNSPGIIYDSNTHEHLGEYLRFLRDYYGLNLMSLYNCFNNKICNNIYYKHKIKVCDVSGEADTSKLVSTEPIKSNIDETDAGATITVKLKNTSVDSNSSKTKNNAVFRDAYSIFDSQDSKYRIYALPVKLFQDYTIAIDCSQGLELFCGFYSTTLDTSARGVDLIAKTYQKVNRPFFKQPFLYDKLSVKYWNFTNDTSIDQKGYPAFLNSGLVTRWDIANREQDLKLFIKVPASCRSSIAVLEGDFRGFNDAKYTPVLYNTLASGVTKTKALWEYKQNHAVLNFGDKMDKTEPGFDLNKDRLKPIGKLQLLAFNTGESYPFADRLVEYLSNSAITPIDEIADNIKRAQKVMNLNKHYFRIDGVWEDKMQKIIYDYMMNSGPIKVEDGKLIDTHSGANPKNYGYHPRLGHTSKSTLYDILGYVDKEAEKWYANWVVKNDTAVIKDNIQNVDIYVDENGKSLWDV